MLEDSWLNDKVAIITSGASGFGESTIRLFAKHGAKVIIADIQGEKGILLSNDINSHGGEVTYIHCDVSKESDMKNVVDVAIFKYAQLDVMFNNAGISRSINVSILGTNDEELNRVFNVNAYGSFLGAKHAAWVMMTPAKSGVILFTSSIATLNTSTTGYAYTMSKHAVNGLMKNLCVELGQYGIRVNAISPGAITSPLMLQATSMEKSVIDGLICESGVLKGVVLEAEDVANVALYLASDDAKFVSRLNLVVDGGSTTTNKAFSNAINKHLLA
ncbi:hypothetical protein Ancab_031554 [Ancistrocladus abbreviatus]